MKEILKVLVGSRAHGLETSTSDYDTKAVFIVPTSSLLSLKPNGNKPQYTGYFDGMKDDVAFEVGYFLYLATKSNPTILETMLSPIIDSTPEGIELRSLFPYVWSSKLVHSAFLGYGMSQRKKFMESDPLDTHRYKFAVAWLRNLYQAVDLLRTGDMKTRIVDSEVGLILRRWKEGKGSLEEKFTIEEVLYFTTLFEGLLQETYKAVPEKQVNYEPINDYLLKIRRENFYVSV